MKIKIFTTNKNDKIELSKQELVELLDEAYAEGYKETNNLTTYIPNPYYINSDNITISTSSIPYNYNNVISTSNNDPYTITLNADNMNIKSSFEEVNSNEI